MLYFKFQFGCQYFESIQNGIAEGQRLASNGKTTTGKCLNVVFSNFNNLFCETLLGHFLHGGTDPTVDFTNTVGMLKCNNDFNK